MKKKKLHPLAAKQTARWIARTIYSLFYVKACFESSIVLRARMNDLILIKKDPVISRATIKKIG